jgi:two-component system, NarL family, response regulator DegU
VPNHRARASGARLQDIRLVLVGQHALVRAVLREIVEAHPQIQVIAEAADVDEAIDMIRDAMPDIVLVDTELPIYQIVPAVQRLKHECPGSPVVLLGHRSSDDELFAAIQAGAAAHVLDDARPSELVRTIRAVADGEYLIDEEVAARPAVARHVLEAFRDASLFREVANHDLASTAFAPLSPREAEILEAIARGMTNKDVAAALSIGEQTVKNHVTSILRKLAVNGRTQAVLYALRKSWIGISDEPPRRRN